MTEADAKGPGPKPPWLKVKLGHGPACARLESLLHENRLNTVCEEAQCPNKGECWQQGRATIMILGDVCTRKCLFCGVGEGGTGVCDAGEPDRVAQAVRATGLREVVVTSVTRDDLSDGGAGIWAETVRQIHEAVPGIFVEVLVPDFGGDMNALARVVAARPEVFGHNLETVPSRYETVRPRASYEQSLRILRTAHEAGLVTKTSLMVGIGETDEELLTVMDDALAAGCEIFAIGQYLQPSRAHLPVERYVTPDQFDEYRIRGEAMGFGVVISGPLVRSSYHTEAQDAYVRKRLA